MSDNNSNSGSFLWPALGIIGALVVLFVLMVLSDRQYGPGLAYTNQNVGEQVYDSDPGSRGERDDIETTYRDVVDPSEVEGLMQPEEQIRMAENLGRTASVPEGAATCSGHCECPQGDVCVPGRGRCVSVAVDVFCCESEGCPSGAPCVDRDGTASRCQ